MKKITKKTINYFMTLKCLEVGGVLGLILATKFLAPVLVNLGFFSANPMSMIYLCTFLIVLLLIFVIILIIGIIHLWIISNWGLARDMAEEHIKNKK